MFTEMENMPKPAHHNADITHPILSERIQAIVSTEKSIDDLMKVAKETMADLAKEKQISKLKMEEHANRFRTLITQVENQLSTQMAYLSHVCVGSSHQGSTFGTLQNSLLAQSGCSSLHSELAGIAASINPPPPDINNLNDIETLDDAAATSSASAAEDVTLESPPDSATEGGETTLLQGPGQVKREDEDEDDGGTAGEKMEEE